MRRTFSGLKRNIAVGPDNLSLSVLQHCAAELVGVFTHIFNTALSQSSVLLFFKESIIISLSKTNTISCLSDYRSISLTSAAMKSLEHIILKHLKTIIPRPHMDSYQFAYTANRSAEDTVNLAIHHILKHLESANPYARILFMEFCSTFSTINPVTLLSKLLDMNINPCTFHWINSFLWTRQQRVRINNNNNNSFFVLGLPLPPSSKDNYVFNYSFTYAQHLGGAHTYRTAKTV